MVGPTHSNFTLVTLPLLVFSISIFLLLLASIIMISLASWGMMTQIWNVI